LQKICKNFK